jgi:signal peptidase I
VAEAAAVGGSEKPPDKRRSRSFWRELPVLIIVALGLALLIKTFLLQAFYIPSGSMENTLVPNDRVLVNKLAYRLGDVQRGDVIVFAGTDSWKEEVQITEPSNPVTGVLRKAGELFGFAPIGEKDFIKRVIGLPGDKVRCCDTRGRVTVNGKPLQETGYLYPNDKPSDDGFSVTVPAGRLWVMGDHRSGSSDSRWHQFDQAKGTIPIDHVIGRAFVVVWPLDRTAVLSRPPAFTEAGL